MGPYSPLEESLCRRGRVIVAEDKARDRVPSSDSARERNAVIRPQGPDAARMDCFNGLLSHSQRHALAVAFFLCGRPGLACPRLTEPRET